MKKGFIFPILSATLWGFTGTVAKLLFRGTTSPLALVEVRLTLSAALLGLFLGVVQRRLLLLSARDIPYFIVLGVAGMAGVQFTYLFTISQTTVATAVFLQSLAPSLIFLHAALFKGERLTAGKFTALALTLCGSILMIQGRGGGRGLYPWGLASGLASAFFAAFYTIYSKRALARYHPLTVNFWALAFGAVPWWFILPPGRLLSAGFTTNDLFFFLYIAVFSTVVPFTLYFQGLRDLTPGQAGIISTLEPVVATATAYLVLGERLSLARGTGGALVLLGILLLRLLPSTEELPAGTRQRLNKEAGLTGGRAIRRGERRL
ncbi:MAG: EamA family transporter [Bacillota bacterium]|nr:EamA family transporter [Bacillota bacterium]